jgi:5-methylcytosine-specific restriction enzyme A
MRQTLMVKVYLFEVFTKGRYRYYGQVTLVESPYPAKQLDYKKRNRNVWIFPLRRVSIENAGDKEVPIDLAISEEDFLKEQQLKEKQARQLTDNELRNKLEGIAKEPVIQQVLSNRYERNAIIGELARRKAKGKCQLCNSFAPFMNRDNVPYLEVHHIDWLSKGGKDSIDNTVALCPNCHRKMQVLDLDRDKAVLRNRIKLP